MFNSPIKWTIDERGHYIFHVKMYEYKVLFIPEALSEVLSYSHLKQYQQSINNIIHSYQNKEKTQIIEVSFTQDGQYSIRSTSNEIKVYSTVVNTILDYVHRQPSVGGIMFTGREPSRRKLNSRIVKYLAKRLNSQYIIEDLGHEEYCFLVL